MRSTHSAARFTGRCTSQLRAPWPLPKPETAAQTSESCHPWAIRGLMQQALAFRCWLLRSYYHHGHWNTLHCVATQSPQMYP